MEEKSKKRGCLACSASYSTKMLGASPAVSDGLSVVMAVAVCERDGLQTVKNDLCLKHRAFLELADKAMSRFVEPGPPVSDAEFEERFASLKPGENKIGACRHCGVPLLFGKSEKGEVLTGHMSPICSGYQELIKSAKDLGALVSRVEAKVDPRTLEIREVPPAERPS